MAKSFLVRRTLVGSLLAGAALVCACGSRGPLDDVIVIQAAPVDGSMLDVGLDAASELAVEAEAEAAPEAMADVREASRDTSMGMDAGALVNCGTCVANNCGNDLVTCITSPGCTAALQCVATSCLTGGTPNIQCLTGCTMGNSTTQSQLLFLVGCIIGTCGSDCTSLLSGLGGIGGGG